MYSENLMIKIPKELKEQLKEEAELRCQTVSDYVRGLIVKDLRENKF
jgi:predicted DNA-binding protein